MKNKFIQYPLILSIIGIVCALCLAVVYWITNPIIEKRLNAAATEAIQEIYTSADMAKDITTEHDDAVNYTISNVYEVYEGSDVVAMAYTATGQGYDSSGIKYTVVITLNDPKIIGLKILAQSETQGFGADLLTSSAFLSQFENLPVGNVESGVADVGIGATRTLTGLKASLSQVVSFHNDVIGGGE